LEKILLGCVVTVDAREFFGAEDADGLEQLRADLVLAAVAAGHGEETRAHAHAAREEGEHAVVLVIRMRRDVENVERHGQPPQREAEAGGAGVLRDRGKLRFGVRGEAEEEEAQNRDEARERTRGHGAPAMNEGGRGTAAATATRMEGGPSGYEPSAADG
jgi:hypothetical protein